VQITGAWVDECEAKTKYVKESLRAPIMSAQYVFMTDVRGTGIMSQSRQQVSSRGGYQSKPSLGLLNGSCRLSRLMW
jgi:hypothetical protein